MGSCGFWNVRGLNSINKQLEIKHFLNKNNVGLFGLVETKIKSHSWNKVRNTLCETWSICTNSSLHSGGRVWLLWDPSMFDVNVKDVTAQAIHSEVYDKFRRKTFWYTLVYGFNKAAERESLWNSIINYHRSINGPWMVTQDCNLVDLKATGAFFTWNNKHETGDKVYSRIDMVLINDDWVTTFPDSVANFLPEGLFDHCPCLISLECSHQQRTKSFKYFNMWALSKEFDSTVRYYWSTVVQGTPMFRVVQKLKLLKKAFRNLNREQFSDIENLTNVAELALKDIQVKLVQDPLNSELCHTEKICAAELGELLKARNMFLSQKAKAAWIAEGDENSSYFHSVIKNAGLAIIGFTK
ncbi:uncharacterized protein LOC141595394 [Silene latifolia]|uniref:uncharacterized protein LOC141595394 n=1 Tax=Silene latifolia TaxID=37657 RepID=UPI003D7833F7